MTGSASVSSGASMSRRMKEQQDAFDADSHSAAADPFHSSQSADIAVDLDLHSSSSPTIHAFHPSTQLQLSEGNLSASASTSASSRLISLPQFRHPPQLGFGWWLDVPPPRGPYLWPCVPESYQLIPMLKINQPNQANQQQQQQQTTPAQHTENPFSNTQLNSPAHTCSESAPSPDHFHSSLDPLVAEVSPPPLPCAADCPSNDFSLGQAPQMAFGWWMPQPPPSGPYLWTCLPPGFTLVPIVVPTTHQHENQQQHQLHSQQLQQPQTKLDYNIKQSFSNQTNHFPMAVT